MTELQAAELLSLVGQIIDQLAIVRWLLYTAAGSIGILCGMYSFRLFVLAKNERDLL